MNDLNESPPEPEEEEQQFVRLDDVYEPAFIGVDMSINHRPRACYSLPLLMVAERRVKGCGVLVAQNSIAAMVGTCPHRL